MVITQTKFYPGWEAFEDAEFHAISTEDTYFIKEHLIDGSLMTFWRPTSYTPMIIDIDTNKTDHPTTVWGIGVFVHDYTVDHSNGNTAKLKISHSDNASAWTQIGEQSITDNDKPIILIETSSVQLKRYVRFEFTGMATYIQVSHLFCGRRITTGQGPVVPRGVMKSYENISIRGQYSNGINHGYISANYRDGLSIEDRLYVATTQTEYDDLAELFDYARGNRGLVVMQDYNESSGYDPSVIRLSNRFIPNIISSQLWTIPVHIEEIPYHTGGKQY